MIRIEINNENIWLENKTKLRLELNSTLFETDVIPGSIVYPFNIPVRGNEAKFNHAHFVEINKTTRSYACNLFIGNSIRFSCNLLLKTLSPKYYRSSIIINTFSSDFKDLNLKDLVYDDITIGGTPHSGSNVVSYANNVVKGITTADFTFPVIFAEFFYGDPDDDTDESEFNPDYGGDTGSGKVGKYINNFNTLGGTFVVNSIDENPIVDNAYTLVPMPYLIPAMRKLFNRENYYIFGDFCDDLELQKLIIINNYPLDQKYKKYFVRASHNAVQYIGSAGDTVVIDDDSTGENEDDDSCFNTGTYKYEILNKGYHFVQVKTEALLLIFAGNTGTLRLTLLQNGVQVGDYAENAVNSDDFTKSTYSFTNYFSNVEVNDLLEIKAEFFLYGTPHDGQLRNFVVTFSNSSWSDLNQFSNTMNLVNHLPDIKSGSFLNAIRTAFGLGVFYDFESKEIQFDFSKDIVTSPNYIDLTDQSIPEETELEFSEATGFTFNIDYHRDVFLYDNYEYLGAYDTYGDLPTPSNLNKVALVLSTNTINIYRKDHDTDELGWFFFSDNFYDVVTGDGSGDIVPELSTLAMHLGNDLLTAQTKEVASSPDFETGINDMGFILAFDRGMQEDDNGDDYPMASSINFDLAGASIGNYTLVMDGENGLYEQFLKPWYEFILNSEEVRKMFVCNEKQMFDIINLFSPQRGKKTRKCRVDNINYLPKRFSFIISMEGIEQVEGILVKKGGETL